MTAKLKKEQLPYLDDFINGACNITGCTITPLENSSNTTVYCSSSSSGTYTTNTVGGSTRPTHIWTGGTTTIPVTYPPVGTPPYAIPSPSWDWGQIEAAVNSTHIIIHDENGEPKKLSIAEVSRYYAEAVEYRKIKRFARLFPMIKELLNELLVAMKLSDPNDDEELNRLEEELRDRKKK